MELNKMNRKTSKDHLVIAHLKNGTLYKDIYKKTGISMGEISKIAQNNGLRRGYYRNKPHYNHKIKIIPSKNLQHRNPPSNKIIIRYVKNTLPQTGYCKNIFNSTNGDYWCWNKATKNHYCKKCYQMTHIDSSIPDIENSVSRILKILFYKNQ